MVHPAGRRSAAVRLLASLVGLAVLVGAAIGFGHWRLSVATGGDVRSSTPVEVDGALSAAGENVFVTETSADGIAAVRVRDGRVLFQADDVNRVSLGEDGRSVTWGVATDQNHPPTTAYDPDGRELWSKTLPRDFQILAINDSEVVLRLCRAGRDNCVMRAIGNDGRPRWERPVPAGAQRSVAVSDEPSVVTGMEDARREPQVAVMGTANKVAVLDARGRVVGPEVPWFNSALNGRTLVTWTREQDNCTFTGWRDGKEVWSEEMACVEDPNWRRSVGDLVYADLISHSGAESQALVFDASTGRSHLHDFSLHPFDPDDLTSIDPGPSVIVSRTETTITGIDPLTGDELWRRDAPAPTPALTSNERTVYVGIGIYGDVVALGRFAQPWWAFLAVGRDVPSGNAVFLDARSGEQIAQFRSPESISVVSVERRQVVVLNRGRVLVLGDN